MSETKIKICGLFRLCDAEYINNAMPDYAGFVFYNKSHRNVTPEQARKLRTAINPAIITVGVFVEAPMQQINALYQDNIISTVQLHGNESNDYISELRNMLPDTAIWQAFKIRSSADLEAAALSTADMVLLDNGYGTGECFDWSLIQGLQRSFILAGGLTPENIPDAISRFHPYALDISSGVESNGIKDRQKILASVAAARRS